MAGEKIGYATRTGIYKRYITKEEKTQMLVNFRNTNIIHFLLKKFF